MGYQRKEAKRKAEEAKFKRLDYDDDWTVRLLFDTIKSFISILGTKLK